MPQSDQAHALYPGSFDVLTLGHLDVLRRAARMFPKVTIAVAHNPSKSVSLFTVDERLDMLRECTADFANVQVDHFAGLTVDFARRIRANVILRGLRAISDFEYELQMAMMNESLDPDVYTVFMAPAPKFSFLSSSLVKEIAHFGGDVTEYVPAPVAARVRARMEAAK